MPRADPLDQEAWIDADNVYPTPTGAYRTCPLYEGYGTSITAPSSPGFVKSAWMNQFGYVTIGTTTKLYTTVPGFSIDDVSRTAGYTLSSASLDNWSFVLFGQKVIATNYKDAPQERTYNALTSTKFQDITGTPPKAKWVVTQSNAVVLFNYDDGANQYTDGWWASDIGDYTQWTPASSNDAANGRLLEKGGPITAAIAFKEVILVFKANAVFSMKYVGQPIIWQIDLLASNIGANYQGGVCNCGDFVVFSGNQGVMMFDGATFKPLDNGKRGPYLPSLGGDTTQAIFYPKSGDVVFAGSGQLATQYISSYNIYADAWGKFRSFYVSGGIAADLTPSAGWAPIVGTNDSLTISEFQLQGGSNQSAGITYVNLSNSPPYYRPTGQLPSTDLGTGARPYLVTSYFGNHMGMTQFTRVQPIWSYDSVQFGTNELYERSAYYLYPYRSDTGADDAGLTALSTVTVSGASKRFDFNYTGRFMKFEIRMTDFGAMRDVNVVQKPAGTD